MRTSNGLPAALLALSLVAFSGCAAGVVVSEDDPELNSIRQGAVETVNGLRTINGLRAYNGLVSINGLTTRNGLRLVNGLRTINGLTTRNGLRSYNGLSIDCTGKTAGVSCVGEPDGLLSAATGMMSSDDGIATATYVVRCALAEGDAIRVKDYTGGLVTLAGEVGLAPAWKDAGCDLTCQERVSACLMAFTNGDGNHVELEMTAPFTIGADHSSEFPYHEAAFFGNLFLEPAQAYYCVGRDYATSSGQLETRACQGYNEQDGSCPYRKVGYCGEAPTSSRADQRSDDRCTFVSGSEAERDTAKSCKTSSSFLAKTWSNPITTFRDVLE